MLQAALLRYISSVSENLARILVPNSRFGGRGKSTTCPCQIYKCQIKDSAGGPFSSHVAAKYKVAAIQKMTVTFFSEAAQNHPSNKSKNIR